jgi:membrane associated rhomboid family serine protease
LIPIKDNIPTDRFPFVTLGLIIANVVVYVLAIGHGGSFFSGPTQHELVKYGAVPHALTHNQARYGIPAWETVFTSMFVHASFVQLIGNLLFLWLFGNNVEYSMGPARFIVFYLVGGVAALALLVAIGPKATDPTVGAAGAIAAVISGYIVLYPRGKVLTLVLIPFLSTVIEVPVLIMLVLWFAEQAVFAAVGLTTPGSNGGAAYLAHVGGLAFGALAIRAAANRRNAVAV